MDDPTCPYEEALERVLAIQPEDHATTDRDFGRGFSHAVALVREAAKIEETS